MKTRKLSDSLLIFGVRVALIAMYVPVTLAIATDFRKVREDFGYDSVRESNEGWLECWCNPLS